MGQIKKLGIFCGSSEPKDRDLKIEIVKFLEELFKITKFDVVYGGANIGIMGEVANIALKNSKLVYGVMPGFLKDREVDHRHLTSFELCETMHERKEKMYILSDAFLILPGGFGTLDEFFEILTWRQLNLHQKPIYLFDALGFFAPLVSQLNNMKRYGMIAPKDLDFVKIIKSAAELK